MWYKKFVCISFFLGLAMSSQVRAFETLQTGSVILDEAQPTGTFAPKIEKCSCSKKKKKSRS